MEQLNPGEWWCVFEDDDVHVGGVVHAPFHLLNKLFKL